jgi:dihydrofolate reductase
MRNLYAFLMTSLDGYHEDADGTLAWANLSDDFAELSDRQLRGIDTLVFGRRTYEGMVAYWTAPEVTAEPSETARSMTDAPKLVASTTLDGPGWANVEVIPGDVAAHLRGLKAGPGRDIAVFGSSTLVAGLLGAGVVDELRIIVMPTLLGAGRTVLDGLAGPVGLDLLWATVYGSGNIHTCYRPRPASAA